MRKNIVRLSAITGLVMALAIPALAAEKKEVTVTGEAKCAKCALKESDKCQNVLQTEKDGKTVTYYLAKNDVTKELHEKICKEPKKMTVTGKVKEVDGKMQLTASKISDAQ